MIEFGFNRKDVVKVLWTFVQAAGGFLILQWTTSVGGEPFNGRALLVGAVAAGISAVKNALLSDNAPLKG